MARKMERFLDALRHNPLVAVVRVPQLAAALPLARALLEGGAGAIEFTLTSDGALEAIESVAALPEVGRGRVLVGAGTVLTPSQAQNALLAGADFVVSPVTDADVLGLCNDVGAACIAGAFTPTEILNAWRMGAAVIKVFPAGVLGPGYFKDVLAPLPGLRLMPTGGVTADNIRAYLDNGAFAVGVGAAMVEPKLVAAEDWDALTRRVRLFAERVRRKG